MATNKNQHFVPRCYLRPFTVDAANTAINLYNIDRKKFIRFAPVKNQCSGDYFYGKDERLERVIKPFEDAYGAALREILKPGYVLTDAHRTTLRLFWLLQYLRTEAAARRSAENTDSINDAAGIKDTNFRLSIKNAVISAMHIFDETKHIIDDLRICLIKNKTKLPFITSDDPAILTNRWWLTDKRTQGRSFGLKSSGVLILLPLSPELLCLGYDGAVYSVRHDRGIVDVRRDSDIASFNQHQVLNCRANLFVKNSEHSIVVHEAFLEAAENRPIIRHKINYAVFDRLEKEYEIYRAVKSRLDEEHTGGLIHSQVIHSVPLSWPSQITRSISNGAIYTNGTAIGYVRYAETVRLFQESFHKEKAYPARRKRG